MAEQTFKQFTDTILANELIEQNDIIVVAVSGGIDSLALLHMLVTLRETLDFQLHVATLDHGLRGRAGMNDALFVQNMAESWNLTVSVGHLKRISPSEAAAREERYNFLASVAEMVGSGKVFVAHHADDQAETVLLRLIRGSGLQGVSGMQSLMSLPGTPRIRLVRPLLHITRAQLETYCFHHNLKPRHDSTNTNSIYMRNYLRNAIIPQLKHINPNVIPAIHRFSLIAAQQADFIAEHLAQQIDEHLLISDNRIRLPLDIFNQLHPTLQSEFIVRSVKEIRPGTEPTFQLVDHALDVLKVSQIGAVAQMTQGVEVRRDYDYVIVEHESTPSMFADIPLLAPNTDIKVNIPGETVLNEKWILHIVSAEAPNINPLHYSARICLPDLPIRLRTRRPGDRIHPRGLKGRSQKLKKWMIDHKIPVETRDHLPLLIVEDEIFAIVFGQRWSQCNINVKTSCKEYLARITRNTNV